MADPKFRKTWDSKHKKGITKREQNPVYRKRIIDANKRKAKDPAWLQANAQAAKINSKKYWSDPAAQKKKSIIQKKIAQRPEMRKIAKRNGLLTTARHKDPVFQKKHRKLVKDALNDPVNKKKHLEAIKKRTQSKAWQEANKRGHDKQKIRCAVKPTGKPWKIFKGFNVAAKFYHYPGLGNTPRKYFKIDGSVYTKLLGKYKGWQTKRLIK